MSDAHLFWLSAVLNEIFEVQFDIIIQVDLKQAEIIIIFKPLSTLNSLNLSLWLTMPSIHFVGTFWSLWVQLFYFNKTYTKLGI